MICMYMNINFYIPSLHIATAEICQTLWIEDLHIRAYTVQLIQIERGTGAWIVGVKHT